MARCETMIIFLFLCSPGRGKVREDAAFRAGAHQRENDAGDTGEQETDNVEQVAFS